MAEKGAFADRFRPLSIWRYQAFGYRFGVYLTGWFYFTNHSYTGERRYFVRVGEWRRSFGPVRR